MSLDFFEYNRPYMAHAPPVSVLIPCYNASGTLLEALLSLKRQTFSDFEVLAVDDGSTDGTLDLLRGWVGEDARFKVIAQPHAGIITALNSGLAACRAPLVARMDADDRSHPERLEHQLSFLNDHPEVGTVGCLVEGFPPDQVRQGFHLYIEWLNSLVRDEDIRREIFVESPLVHPSVIYRKVWIDQVGGYQEHGWPEDYDLWLRLYLAGARFAKVPEVLFDWREDPGRLTRLDNRYSVENFLRLKAFYLARGPLVGRDAIIVWGAGMMGRRLSKHLQRMNLPLRAFVDVDPRKIGRTRRGLPILSPEGLPGFLRHFTRPVLLAAVGARGARPLIRARLKSMGLQEGLHWWCVA
jgi:glycosyltransferase involved in cell wall biosynthesis